ncbi:Carrier domain-containing protein [Vibrio chagasii]|uniref:acyl carrier protein n=1 Tax=unclassified Vibrio TaxID=2614977 RepID=UPI001493B4CD|nr:MULTISPECIES: acyl carrier protein [unclassified Vibrio]CAH6799842.1 Carrier domain-containing protein [Vibrio chagasii]NOI37753.1 acyl carrier protein [Vibrio sp. 070316B]NOI88651.1 acyl carrier protein [Vibrio sp. 99K-1]CAH6859775.1 Carrier domain-containing protein [Vibrio chagasii]CAH6868710.1 Carrier domain-containing protein [Vibrio chagasii]
MSNVNQLLEIVAEILEVDDVSLETPLNEDNWDSLAVVTFISEADNEFDKVVSPSEVNKVTKVADLLELIK